MTTGISIAGRMSVFIRLVDSKPKIAMSEQSTAMVYGRLKASRTIHMRHRLQDAPRPLFDAPEPGGLQAESPRWRFPPRPARALRGRHAPTGLRPRRGVQRESETLAPRPPGARLPGRAAPGADPGGGDAAVLPLPEPKRGRPGQAGGLEARIRTRVSHRPDRPVRLRRAPGDHLALAAHRGRLRTGARLHHRPVRDFDARPRSQRADEHRPGAAGAARV